MNKVTCDEGARQAVIGINQGPQAQERMSIKHKKEKVSQRVLQYAFLLTVRTIPPRSYS